MPKHSVLYSELTSRPPVVQPVAQPVAPDAATIPMITPVFKTPGPDGPYHDEIIVEINSLDGESYTGTVTMQEAKYGIYRDGLGFKEFKNFGGVRFAFKGVRTVVLNKSMLMS